MRRNAQPYASMIDWPVMRLLLGIMVAFVLVGLVLVTAQQPLIGLMLTVGLPSALALFAWPPVSLALYANAGLFKADPRLSSLSSFFDITILLGIILAAAIAYRLIVRRERIIWKPEMSLILAFAAVVLLGLLYTPAGAYATDKAIRFISLTLLAFFAPLVTIRSYRSLWLFLIMWLGFATIIAIDALAQSESGQRLSGFSATSIAIGRTTGVAVLIWVFAVLGGDVRHRWRVIALTGIALMVVTMLGAGARGPMLMLGPAIILTVIAGMSAGRTNNLLRFAIIIIILGIIIAGVLYLGLIPETSLDRFDIFFNQNNADTSTQARLLVGEVAWQLFKSSPLIGRGTGSVSAFGYGQDQFYPHNIILELAAELGVIGLSLYLAVVGVVVWRLLRTLINKPSHEPLYLTLLALLIFTLFNAMVSGDLSDNRDMWLFAGIALAGIRLSEEARS